MNIFTTDERGKMADIFNDAISKTEFGCIRVSSDNFEMTKDFGGGGFIKLSDINNPLTRIFSQAAVNKVEDKGQFYHFKSFGIAQKIISNKSIQVSNLLSNDENDFAEYSEFFKRLGVFHQLIPNDYQQQLERQQYNPASLSKVDEIRQNTLVLCLSKSRQNKKFWNEYASDETGVCICFRFSDFNPEIYSLYEFRDICYDNGYQFDFLNHINYHFRKKFDRHLFIDGISKFPKFYKRKIYDWEEETRLCFTYDFNKFGLGTALQKIFPLNDCPEGSTRKFIELPLKGHNTNNPFFTLTIDEVICGKNISPEGYQLLESNLNENFPGDRIWQRI